MLVGRWGQAGRRSRAHLLEYPWHAAEVGTGPWWRMWTAWAGVGTAEGSASSTALQLHNLGGA